MIYYILLMIILVLIVLFLTRKFNFLLVYFACSIVYYFPALFGVCYYGKLPITIEKNTYIALAINLIVPLVVYFIFYSNKKYSLRNSKLAKPKKVLVVGNKIERKFSKIINIVMVGLLIYFFYYMYDGIFGRVYDKAYLLSIMPKTLEYYMYFLSIWTIHVFTDVCRHSLFEKVICLLGMAFTFLLGIRSFIVIVFLAVIVNKINKEWINITLNKYLRKNIKIIVAVVIMFLLTFFVKDIYSAFFAGDYNYVTRQLGESDYYIDEIKYSEPNVITRNLNLIIANDYQSSTISYFQIFKLLIPGLTKFTGYSYSFSNEYQAELYGSNRLNNASTFLGEAYANGGILMIFIVITILSVLLFFVYKLYSQAKYSIYKSFLLALGIDLSFYICRNDAAYAFMRFRYYAYGIIIVVIIRAVMSRIYNSNFQKIESNNDLLEGVH